jgi:hypothetical protein
MQLEDEPKLVAIEKCVACQEQEATGTYWNEMRLCGWCGGDLIHSPEYEAAHQEANKNPLGGVAGTTIPLYQAAAGKWLARVRAETRAA